MAIYPLGVPSGNLPGGQITPVTLPGLVEIDVASQLYRLEPDVTPLLQITAHTTKKRPTETPDYVHWEKDTVGYRKIVATSAVSGNGQYDHANVTIPVDNASNVRVNDIIVVPRTREQMLVTSILSTTQIVVTKGYAMSSPHAGVPSGNILQWEELIIAGSAYPENSSRPDVRYVMPVRVDNTTQIFRHSFGTSGTLESTRLYTGATLTEQQVDALAQHKVAIELAFIFGQYKVSFDSNGNRRGVTRGFISYIENQDTYPTIPACVFDWTGLTITDLVMERLMMKVFRYGSKKKVLIGGRPVISQINLVGRDRVRTGIGEKQFGFDCQTYISFHGRLDLVASDLLESGVAGHNNNIGGKIGLIVDPQYVYYRYLSGNGISRDTKLRLNEEDKGKDGKIHSYLTECGFQLICPPAHGLIINCPDV